MAEVDDLGDAQRIVRNMISEFLACEVSWNLAGLLQ